MLVKTHLMNTPDDEPKVLQSKVFGGNSSPFLLLFHGGSRTGTFFYKAVKILAVVLAVLTSRYF